MYDKLDKFELDESKEKLDKLNGLKYEFEKQDEFDELGDELDKLKDGLH